MGMIDEVTGDYLKLNLLAWHWVRKIIGFTCAILQSIISLLKINISNCYRFP